MDALPDCRWLPHLVEGPIISSSASPMPSPQCLVEHVQAHTRERRNPPVAPAVGTVLGKLKTKPQYEKMSIYSKEAWLGKAQMDIDQMTSQLEKEKKERAMLKSQFFTRSSRRRRTRRPSPPPLPLPPHRRTTRRATAVLARRVW